MKSKSTPRLSNASFTLVELLVVIAIISILASLLMPALQKAVASAKQASCSARIKQLGLAMVTYADDYNQFHVYDPYFSTQGNPTWPNLLHPFLGHESGQPSTFLVDPANEEPYYTNTTQHHSQYAINSVVATGQIQYKTNSGKSLKASRMSRPAEAMLAMCGTDRSRILRWQYIRHASTERLRFPHLSKQGNAGNANILHGDLHVDNYDRDDIPTGTTTQQIRELPLWNPEI